MPKDGILPQFPGGAEYLWDWWCEMRELNGDDFSTRSIQSFFDINGIEPKHYEVKAIIAINRALIASRQSS